MENLTRKLSNEQIDSIINALDNDMICFMNPNTLETEYVSHDVLIGMYRDDTCEEALRRVDQWEKYMIIDRPALSDMLKIMQVFIKDCIPGGKLKERLHNALSLRYPDKYFHEIVEDSSYRDKWAAYNHRHMMWHVRRKLRDIPAEKSSLPSVEFV